MPPDRPAAPFPLVLRLGAAAIAGAALAEALYRLQGDGFIGVGPGGRVIALAAAPIMRRYVPIRALGRRAPEARRSHGGCNRYSADARRASALAVLAEPGGRADRRDTLRACAPGFPVRRIRPRRRAARPSSRHDVRRQITSPAMGSLAMVSRLPHRTAARLRTGTSSARPAAERATASSGPRSCRTSSTARAASSCRGRGATRRSRR